MAFRMKSLMGTKLGSSSPNSKPVVIWASTLLIWDKFFFPGPMDIFFGMISKDSGALWLEMRLRREDTHMSSLYRWVDITMKDQSPETGAVDLLRQARKFILRKDYLLTSLKRKA